MKNKNSSNDFSDIKSESKSKFNLGGVIKLHIMLRLAFKNLIFKKLRTTLTVLGVVIGIGSIVFLVSFGFGLQDLVSRQVVGSSSVQTVDVTSPRTKALKLNPTTIQEIKGYTGVEDVVKVYNSAGRIKFNSSQLDSVVYGVEPGYLKLSSLKYVNGNETKDMSGGVLVNTSLLKAIGITDSNKSIGQKIAIAFSIDDAKTDQKKTVTKTLPILGVIESESQAEAFINYKAFEDEGMIDASQIKVVVSEENLISPVRKAIEGLGFTTTSPLDTLNQINQVFSLLRLVLIGFGGIGMIIAILGMFNTLTISLLERTREIGLMISLGARKQDVRMMFITEALMLSLIGCVVGIFAAWVLGIIGNSVLNNFASQRGVTDQVTAFIVVPKLVLITLVLSLVVGMLVVYFPARRASQIDPIEALSNE